METVRKSSLGPLVISAVTGAFILGILADRLLLPTLAPEKAIAVNVELPPPELEPDISFQGLVLNSVVLEGDDADFVENAIKMKLLSAGALPTKNNEKGVDLEAESDGTLRSKNLRGKRQRY